MAAAESSSGVAMVVDMEEGTYSERASMKPELDMEEGTYSEREPELGLVNPLRHAATPAPEDASVHGGGEPTREDDDAIQDVRTDEATVILQDGSMETYHSVEEAEFVALLTRHKFNSVAFMVNVIHVTGDTANPLYRHEQASHVFHLMNESGSGFLSAAELRKGIENQTVRTFFEESQIKVLADALTTRARGKPPTDLPTDLDALKTIRLIAKQATKKQLRDLELYRFAASMRASSKARSSEMGEDENSDDDEGEEEEGEGGANDKGDEESGSKRRSDISELSFEDWSKFLERKSGNRARYLARKALLRGYVYNGHGLQPGEEYVTNEAVLTKLQGALSSCGRVSAKMKEARVSKVAGKMNLKELPRGYWDDYRNFIYNNHPVLSLCYANPLHPYSKYERLSNFFLTVTFSCYVTGEISARTPDDRVWWMTIVLVTIPVILLNTLGFYFFACPCLLHDASTATCWKKCCYKCLDCSGKCCYLQNYFWALIFVILCILVWGTYPARDRGDPEDLSFFLVGLLQSWIYAFVAPLLIQFWPYEKSAKEYGPTIAKYTKIPFGRWWLERDKVLEIICEKREGMAIEESFFLPRQEGGTK